MEKVCYKNIYYFKKICAIGGTEQFLYEIAKKYNDYDITIFYDEADREQLNRLKRYVRCKKRNPSKKITCEKAFYNFNLDMIEQVDAKEHIFVSHANYEILGYKPPIEHKKLDRFISVSQFACEKLNEYSDKLGVKTRAELVYNPLTLEPKEKVLRLVCAGRLDDEVRGGDRTLKFIKVLDDYCHETGRHYMLTIFSNPMQIKITSPNVVIAKPRIDVRPYIADSDFLINLANDMETYGYSNNEALGYGVRIVTTPLSVNKELPIPEGANLICEYDMSNAKDIVRQMFECNLKPFSYTPPTDTWHEILTKGKSTYKEEQKMKYRVEALDTYKRLNLIDSELGKIPKEGERFKVGYERLEVLLGDNSYNEIFVKVIEGIKEETNTKKRKTN